MRERRERKIRKERRAPCRIQYVEAPDKGPRRSGWTGKWPCVKFGMGGVRKWNEKHAALRPPAGTVTRVCKSALRSLALVVVDPARPGSVVENDEVVEREKRGCG